MTFPTTSLDICNLALDFVGEPPISNLLAEQKVPQLCSRHYNLARKMELETNKWKIALALEDLSEVANDPDQGNWKSVFQLPTDWLATFDSTLGGYDTPQVAAFETRGQKIYTTASEVRILYARNTENVSEMPAYLSLAIALKLAVHLCIPIKGDDRRAQEIEGRYSRHITEARQANAIIDPGKIWGVDYLTTARLGRNSIYFPHTREGYSTAGYP